MTCRHCRSRARRIPTCSARRKAAGPPGPRRPAPGSALPAASAIRCAACCGRPARRRGRPALRLGRPAAQADPAQPAAHPQADGGGQHPAPGRFRRVRGGPRDGSGRPDRDRRRLRGGSRCAVRRGGGRALPVLGAGLWLASARDPLPPAVPAAATGELAGRRAATGPGGVPAPALLPAATELSPGASSGADARDWPGCPGTAPADARSAASSTRVPPCGARPRSSLRILTTPTAATRRCS